MTPVADPPANAAAPVARPGRLRRVLYAAHLDPSRKFGSLEEQAFLLASAFRERGGLFLPVFLAPPEEVGRAHYEAAGLEVGALGLERFRPGVLARLLRLVARHDIEVIDWNFFPPLTNGYLWALGALAPRLEHYFTDHNSRAAGAAGSSRLKTVKRIFLRRYRRVFAVSRFVADCVGEQGIWPPAVCRLHFVNTERFAPDPEARAEVRRRLGAGDRTVLLTTAYLIKDKGVDVAIRALARLPAEAVLWVVGDGAESAALHALAGELGVRDRVQFLGLQTRVEPYMQAADAFVCPSLWAEAAGLVNLEAQACGLPVVASRAGGIPEYVLDGQTGFLFPPGDAAALANAVRRLLDHPERFREMGREARALAVRQFSPAARLDDYLNLYRSPT